MSALKSFATSRMNQTSDRTTARPKCNKAKILSTHDRAFEQHLTDHGIHHFGCSQTSPANLEDILEALSDSESTLPLFQGCDTQAVFESFLRSHRQAKRETEVVADVIPKIMAELKENSPFAMDKTFKDLEPLTNDDISSAMPDLCYGALPDDLDPDIRNELAGLITPGVNIPILPNFFLEVKGPDGRPSVATRQARYDGALGTRAMHSLQNYMEEKPIYDNNAYSFSATYQDGHLVLFAHHLTAPTTPGGRPEYHMTQLKGYASTSDRETFIRAVLAFRNLHDSAKRYRDDFIKAANSRHRASASATEPGNKIGPWLPKPSQH